MAGDTESRFGFLAGLVACVLVLALTLMAMSPEAAPSVFQAMSLEPIGLEAPQSELPLPTETPSFTIQNAV